MVYKCFFSFLTIHLSVEDLLFFVYYHKNTDSSHYTTFKIRCNLSQAVKIFFCVCNRCLILQAFLFTLNDNGPQFVHPSLGMRVDAKCSDFNRNVGCVCKHSPFLTQRQVTDGTWVVLCLFCVARQSSQVYSTCATHELVELLFSAYDTITT